MSAFLLVIIYITFISLGLPDSLLGSAWTTIRQDLNADLAAAGILSVIISGGTILSSLSSEKMIRRFKTGPVTAFSVFLTAAALLGFSVFPSIWWLAVACVPLGLGAGAVDAALNNYVAVHYKPHHMSWLHCFWGIGALSSPLIMARFLQNDGNWRGGYLFIGIVQFVLIALLCLSLPAWLREEARDAPQETTEASADIPEDTPVLRIPGVPMAMLTFFFYCGIESTISVWGASYISGIKGLEPATAARWISFYFIGITAGRFLTGFLTLRMTSRALIRTGALTVLSGAVMLVLPLPAIFSLIALAVIGLGCAPVFPCTIHETPYRFGVAKSQKIMGIQMAAAYTGTTVIPPLLGYTASNFTGLRVFPYFLLIEGIVLLLASERLERVIKRKSNGGEYSQVL